MQPTIICTAPAPGMVYLNGRFAGEASAERALFLPVAPSGAVYLEYRPLTGAGRPLARRFVLSGGAPLKDSLAEAEGLSCVAWPGGVLEAEFSASPASTEPFSLEGLPCAVLRGEETALSIGGRTFPVPEGALPPRLIPLENAAALLGGLAGGGQYLLALTPDLTASLGLLAAAAIEPADGALFSAVIDLGDSVGHGRLEQWIVDAGGLRRVSSESAWSAGAPRWPETAEGAMIAAVEAVLAGLPAEAEGYLSPALAPLRPLAAIGEVCELCVPMQYGVPDARPSVGLLKGENAHLARVRPLFYAAEPAGGRQGPWQITAVSLE